METTLYSLKSFNSTKDGQFLAIVQLLPHSTVKEYQDRGFFYSDEVFLSDQVYFKDAKKSFFEWTYELKTSLPQNLFMEDLEKAGYVASEIFDKMSEGVSTKTCPKYLAQKQKDALLVALSKKSTQSVQGKHKNCKLKKL